MARTKTDLPEEHRKLLPLTPAVFFILFALADGEKHGYAIMQQVAVLSDGQFRMGPGTLYTTIQRLVEFSLIEEIPAANESDTRRRYYRLTKAGKVLFDAEMNRVNALLRLAQQKKLMPHGAR